MPLPPPAEAHRLHMLYDVCERRFIKRRIGLLLVLAKIDDPVPRRTSRQVHAVEPWLEDIGVRASVRVCGKTQPFPRQIARNVEWTILVDSQESNRRVCRESCSPRQVDAAFREVGVDIARFRAVQEDGQSTVFASKTNQRDPNSGTVDHPGFV